MVWVLASLIVLGSIAALVVGMTRGRPAPAVPPPARTEDTLAQRVRRLEDELDDLHAQLGQLRDDVQYLLRQLEERA